MSVGVWVLSNSYFARTFLVLIEFGVHCLVNQVKYAFAIHIKTSLDVLIADHHQV